MTEHVMDTLRAARTFLFVPGNRPDRFAKAAATDADVIIIDLEDAVDHSDKQQARVAIAEWFANGGTGAIRINAADTPWHGDDVALAASVGAPVVLAKTGSADEVATVAAATGNPVISLIETAAGVLGAQAIAAEPSVARLAIGAIDLAVEIGVDSNDREALAFARSTLVFASTAAGIAPPIDGVTTALDDPSILRDDVTYAARLGMTAKLCIHPRQLEMVEQCLAPTKADIEWARTIVAAARTNGSAVAVNGHMVDAPVVARAQRILAVIEQ